MLFPNILPHTEVYQNAPINTTLSNACQGFHSIKDVRCILMHKHSTEQSANATSPDSPALS